MSNKTVQTGIDQLIEEPSILKRIALPVGYLCHSASVDQQLTSGIQVMKNHFKDQLKALFSPQHGIVSDVQDNMVETPHAREENTKLPIYSLYSETRRPTPEMLKGLKTVIIDLQDVGTRVYTYITTMIYMMEACEKEKIDVVILDRPNPAGGEIIEGNILSAELESFVGVLPIPMRHGMTIGEVALYAKKLKNLDINLKVIKMLGWERSMGWNQTGLVWINPSPNLSTPYSSVCFPGTVLFEGTNISEGRGTTRALEQIGHPEISHQKLQPSIDKLLTHSYFKEIKIRNVSFQPMFQKHQGLHCHGHFIHPKTPHCYTWALGQCLLSLYIQSLGSSFKWKDDGYEYEYDKLAIDFINGDERLRKWAEESGELEELLELEREKHRDFLSLRQEVLLYS